MSNEMNDKDDGIWQDIINQKIINHRTRLLTLRCGHRAKVIVAQVEDDSGLPTFEGGQVAYYCRMCDPSMIT